MPKIEIRTIFNEECKKEINTLFVDDIMFDYLIDEDDLQKARLYCNQNPHLQKAVIGDIMKHFTDSFSEFVGKPYSLKEIVQAINKGGL